MFGCREKIFDQGIEKWDICLDEFGNIGELHSLYQDGVFFEMRLCSFQGSSHDEQRLDSPHTEIVVVLLRKLFRGKFIKLDHLLGENTGVFKTFCEEHDFCDHGIIRDHHGHRSEERLEIIGELGTASVSGIHGDEDAIIGLDGDNFSLELKGVVGVGSEQGHSDDQKLLGDDREYLDIDSVELVQTGPGALLTQSLEQLVHHHGGNLVRTIEDDTKSAECFGEILGGLCLSGSGGSCGRGAQLIGHCAGDGDPASIGEWGDHESTGGPQVLIAVLHEGGDLPVHSFFIDQVVPELLLPEEVAQGLALLLVEIGHDVSVVDFDGDQGHDDFSEDRGDLSSDDSCHFLELGDDIVVEVLLQGLSVVGVSLMAYSV